MLKDSTLITLWIASLLTILEGIALANSLDGTYFTLIVAAVAGLGGYEIQGYRAKEKETVGVAA